MRSTLLAAALAAMSLTVSAQGYGPGGGFGPGYGPHGAGPGMMQGHGMGMMQGGYAARLDDLGLSDEQRAKVRAIQKDVRARQWDLMDQMRDLRWQARKRIDEVLTAEQREKLRQARPPRG